MDSATVAAAEPVMPTVCPMRICPWAAPTIAKMAARVAPPRSQCVNLMFVPRCLFVGGVNIDTNGDNPWAGAEPGLRNLWPSGRWLLEPVCDPLRDRKQALSDGTCRPYR